jgi:hypothetical protein
MGMTQGFHQPALPFLVMNNAYICRFTGGKKWSEDISAEAFARGKFCEDAVIYDVNCRKFPVTGAEKLGYYRDIWNLYGLFNRFTAPEERMYRFRFLVGEPEQLTFEQAQAEITEHICNRRWVGRSEKTLDIVRKRYYAKANMPDFIAFISTWGQWPFFKLKR